MTRLVTIGGTGDVYLVCALLDAFIKYHKQIPRVITRHHYAPIARMFGITPEIDDKLIDRAEQDKNFQRTYDNDLSGTFYVHPSFVRSGARIDRMTAVDASQADMYRALLRLPLDAPLTQPKLSDVKPILGTAFILPRATSWPNDQPAFWTRLERALTDAGWHVTTNNERWSLTELFEQLAKSEWVIGPQCGVMSILVTGGFPCRKTLVTPSVDGHVYPDFWASETFPYAYVTKFAGQDHDVEEHKVGSDDHDAIVRAVVHGPNALRLWQHDPRPIVRIDVPISPGEFLDRLAVLTVKRERFDERRRAAIEREYERYVELRRSLNLPRATVPLFDRLLKLHRETFDLLERIVPAAIAEETMQVEDHVAAIVLNKARITLKQGIDGLCRGGYSEVKSYYRDPACFGGGVAVAPVASPVTLSVLSLPVSRSNHPAPVKLAEHKGINLVQMNGHVYTVPQQLGPINLDTINLSQYPTIRAFPSVDAARNSL